MVVKTRPCGHVETRSGCVVWVHAQLGTWAELFCDPLLLIIDVKVPRKSGMGQGTDREPSGTP